MQKPLQPILDFALPLAPFRRDSETSKAGARSADPKVAGQCLDLLTLYRQGPLTDQDAADALGIYRTSVIPRRRTLMQRGLVKAHGVTTNRKTGVVNTTWGLA
jgi:hypothetical protein